MKTLPVLMSCERLSCRLTETSCGQRHLVAQSLEPVSRFGPLDGENAALGPAHLLRYVVCRNCPVGAVNASKTAVSVDDVLRTHQREGIAPARRKPWTKRVLRTPRG